MEWSEIWQLPRLAGYCLRNHSCFPSSAFITLRIYQFGATVGLQMVGRARGEHLLLSYALVLEEALELDLRPIEPKTQ